MMLFLGTLFIVLACCLAMGLGILIDGKLAGKYDTGEIKHVDLEQLYLKHLRA